VAWKSSQPTVVAWESSQPTVVAWESASIRILECLTDFLKVVLHGFSIAIFKADIKINIEKKSKNAHIQKIGEMDWFEANSVDIEKDFVTLFKRVSKDWKTQEGKKNETSWDLGKTLEHPNWDPSSSECGEGKFHACSRPYFCDEFRTEPTDRYIAIRIAKKDLHAWKNGSYPHKIAFRKGTVLHECDRFGKKV
jgi:hypothetical protein